MASGPMALMTDATALVTLFCRLDQLVAMPPVADFAWSAKLVKPSPPWVSSVEIAPSMSAIETVPSWMAL